MNPRIQVEHTVTEEVTDVDLVQSQMRIASGETLADLGLAPGHASRCAARRCSAGSPPRTRPTASGPTPGGSRRTARPAAPASASTAARRTPAPRSRAHFDSMLAKLTCRGRTFETAVERARRALAEFRIRGVSTNIPFLQAVLDDPDFRGRPRDDRRSSRRTRSCSGRALGGDRGTKLLTYLADVTVNQPHGAGAGRASTRSSKLPDVDLDVPAPDGTRQLLLELGPEGFAARAARAGRRSRSPTPRSATPTSRCSRPGCAPATCSPSPATSPGSPRSCCRSRPGAARRTTWRCASSPRTRGSGWPRCARRCPTSASRCCCAAATPSATRRTRPRSPTRSSQEAAATGIDIFRIFDALNDVEQMRPAIEAVRATGTTVAEVALCYTGDLSDPGEKLYTLDYYLRPRRADRRRRRARAGDQGHGRAAARAGRAHAGHRAARAVRPAGAPAHPRHRRAASSPRCSPRSTPASTRSTPRRASMAGTTSSRRCRRWSPRPTTPTRETGLVARRRSAPWSRTGRPSAASTRRSSPGCPRRPAASTRHEIPGGQLSNLRQQAIALGLGEKFEQIEDMYAAANRHPRQRRQGDAVVQGRRRPRAAPRRASAPTRPSSRTNPAKFDIPDSVIGFLQRRARRPARRLAGAVPHQGARGPHLEAAASSELTDEQRDGPRRTDRRRDAQPAAVPRPDQGVRRGRARRTATCRCSPTVDYLYGLRAGRGARGRARARARRCSSGCEAISEPDERGYPHRDGARINGQLRPVQRPRPQRSRPTSPPPRRPTRRSPATSPRRSPAWSPLAVAEGDAGRGRRRPSPRSRR